MTDRPMKVAEQASRVWLDLIAYVIHSGRKVKPRGMATYEVLNLSSFVSMRYPIVEVPQRNVGYKFMAAEAAWILSGDNRVETIAPYSKEITNFSDDGLFFYGAYGPRIVGQLPYVAKSLAKDRDTRQAVLSIWREAPLDTKDVPCTINMQWFIRDGMFLDCVTNMRSSDAWLGWVYDVFNFSMVSHYLAVILSSSYKIHVQPRNLYINAGSGHLYEKNFDAAYDILKYWADRAPPPSYQPFEFDKHVKPHCIISALWAAARSNDCKHILDHLPEVTTNLDKANVTP